IWNVGYEGFRPDQHVTMVDVDESEVRKFPNAEWVRKEVKEVVKDLYWICPKEWAVQCRHWEVKYPWLEFPLHEDEDGYINAYRFTAGLQKYLTKSQVIVTEMGTALITAHQVLRLKP